MATVILLASTTLANAAVVFQDHFNRPDSHTVGNGWTEIEDTPTEDAQILGHELELSDASVTQHLDLTGKFNTTLEFDWFASLFGDHLDVLLSLDGIAYSLVAKFSLNIPNFQHVTLSLPQADNQPDVYFRWFSTTASHIDDVRVSAAKKVPEPSTGALVGFALLGLWLAARRRGIGACV